MAEEQGNLLGKLVRIQLIDKRYVVGTLEAVDNEGNICIRTPIECRILPPINEGDQNIHETVKMRSAVIPKGKWISIALPVN